MLYDAELQKIATSSSGASISDLNNATLKGTLFTNNESYKTWKANSKDDSNAKKSVDDLVTKTQDDLDSLMNFLLGDYFKGIKYGRPASISEGKSITFANADTAPNEEDNGFSVKSGSTTKYIKGLGLDETDLNTKDIGIGFSGPTGQAIYKALLQKHSNVIDADPSKQYEFGEGQVEGIFNAMVQVANKIADLRKSEPSSKEWKETYMYDQDSSGNAHGSEQKTDVVIRSSSGVVDMPKFFEWLNSDQFFNGRDMTSTQFPTIDGKTDLIPPKQEQAKPQGNDGSSGSGANGAGGAGGGSTPTKTPYKYKSYYVGNEDLVASVIGYKGDTNPNVTKTNGEAGNLYVLNTLLKNYHLPQFNLLTQLLMKQWLILLVQKPHTLVHQELFINI